MVLTTTDPTPFRAAQYVRMSTEHQQYSTNNQADKILEYARHRNIAIVRTYADEGKSGLSIGGRVGLQRLIADVEYLFFTQKRAEHEAGDHGRVEDGVIG